MPGQEIRFDDVATAANGLVQNGLPVTLGAVRDTLATASTRAVQAHLMAWRAGQAQPAVAPDQNLPAAVTAALGSWAQQVAHDAAAPLRDTLSQTQSDLASLIEFHEQVESDLGEQLVNARADHEQAQAKVAARDASIERLTVELRHARDIASNALVGKAKDQLAIDGKDAQVADLRREIERHIALGAAASDARLAAAMELVGAVTARDNFAAEIAELRAQLDARRTALSGA